MTKPPLTLEQLQQAMIDLSTATIRTQRSRAALREGLELFKDWSLEEIVEITELSTARCQEIFEVVQEAVREMERR